MIKELPSRHPLWNRHKIVTHENDRLRKLKKKIAKMKVVIMSKSPCTSSNTCKSFKKPRYKSVLKVYIDIKLWCWKLTRLKKCKYDNNDQTTWISSYHIQNTSKVWKRSGKLRLQNASTKSSPHYPKGQTGTHFNSILQHMSEVKKRAKWPLIAHLSFA